MAPSVKALEAKLRNAVEEVYHGENPESLTVRFVRDKVEQELGLETGFFLKPNWKDKSKILIKEWAVSLIESCNSLLLAHAFLGQID
jgi:hypothetical protein